LLRLLLATFAAGFVLALLAAYFYPFSGEPRLRSLSVTLPNGGREEVFLMHLPEDRLGIPRAAPVASFPRESFDNDGKQSLVAELFRLRNVDGDVVGVASRVSGAVPDLRNRRSQTVDWVLVLPGRGSLSMSWGGQPAGNPRSQQREQMGLNPRRAGIVYSGTQDFSGLEGAFIEETRAADLSDPGQRDGVLSLTTRLRRDDL
jgi:hypothetical protein